MVRKRSWGNLGDDLGGASELVWLRPTHRTCSAALRLFLSARGGAVESGLGLVGWEERSMQGRLGVLECLSEWCEEGKQLVR